MLQVSEYNISLKHPSFYSHVDIDDDENTIHIWPQVSVCSTAVCVLKQC